MACVRRTGRVISLALFSLTLPFFLSFRLLSLVLPLLLSPPCSFFSFFCLIFFLIFLLFPWSFFFLRFPMRGLEMRLINIAGVAASLFSPGCRAASQLLRAIARTMHVCITSAALLFLLLLFLVFPSFLPCFHRVACARVCTPRVENAKHGTHRSGNVNPGEILTRDYDERFPIIFLKLSGKSGDNTV